MPDTAVQVTSLDQVAARFGGNRSDGYLPYAVTGFFLNGGREAHIVRVVGTGSVPASATLVDRQATPAPSLRVTAGYRGAPDPGSWGEALRLDVRDDPRATTTVAAAAAATATTVQLVSTGGVEVGSVLRIATGPAPVARKVTAVNRVSRTATVAPALGTAVTAGTAVTTAEFRLVIRLQDEANGAFPVVEDWRGLSMQPGTAGYVVDRLNHPAPGSRFVTFADLDHGVHPA